MRLSNLYYKKPISLPTTVAGLDLGTWDQNSSMTEGINFGENSKLLIPGVTSAERESATPLEREILYDETEKIIYYGDGVTVGGIVVGTGAAGGGGSGDMLKSIYDTNNDGIVDLAKDISGTPTTNQYYGTNATGTKGFYNLPTSTTNDITLPLNISTNYTLTNSDYKKWIRASGDITITVQSNPIAYFQAIVQNVGTGVITLAGVTDASGTKLIRQWGAFHVYYNGTSWTSVGDLSA